MKKIRGVYDWPFSPHLRFKTRKFTFHVDKFPGNDEEEFVIVEHIKEQDGGYHQVCCDSFDAFLSEFPHRTVRHKELVEKEKFAKWSDWHESTEYLEE